MVEGHIGTVTNYLGTGVMLRIGQFNDYFQNSTGLYDSRLTMRPVANPNLFSRIDSVKREKLKNHPNPEHQEPFVNRQFQAYGFIRPIGRTVLYNSFLQGGWTSRFRSHHTILSEHIERFYVNVEYGGVVSFGRTQLTYSQLFRMREFRQVRLQQWGRISLLLGF